MATKQISSDDYAAIAEKHDKRARKDTTINMRVSSDLLEDIKACAKAEGYPKYQTWLTMALEVMVAESQNRTAESNHADLLLNEIGECFQISTLLEGKELGDREKAINKKIAAKKAPLQKKEAAKKQVSAKSAARKVFKSPV